MKGGNFLRFGKSKNELALELERDKLVRENQELKSLIGKLDNCMRSHANVVSQVNQYRGILSNWNRGEKDRQTQLNDLQRKVALLQEENNRYKLQSNQVMPMMLERKDAQGTIPNLMDMWGGRRRTNKKRSNKKRSNKKRSNKKRTIKK